MNKVSPEGKDLCNDYARFYISLTDLHASSVHTYTHTLKYTFTNAWICFYRDSVQHSFIDSTKRLAVSHFGSHSQVAIEGCISHQGCLI